MTVCTHGLSLDEPCVRCELQKPALTADDYRELLRRADESLAWAISETRASERSRCRAILMHFFGSEWSGNAALEMLDSGEWPEGKK